MPQAIIAGSTGLIGQTLARELSDPAIPVALLSRRDTETQHAHHRVLQTDFRSIQLPAATHEDDVVYCALGTTIKKAGSQEAFKAVDLELVVKVAKTAKDAGFETFVVVSSLGTQPNTRNFYLKTKAQMEAALQAVGFKKLVIVRPSLLLGEREEFRLGERFGEWASALIEPLMVGKLKRYRPVHASDVAKTMIREAAKAPVGVTIIESEAIQP